MNKYDHYLSFGFNCELAFALQKAEIFEPTTFAWADVRGTDALLYGIMHPEQILTGDITRYSANMFFCGKTNIGFHGRQKFNECILANGAPDNDKINESLNELRSRINHLNTKTADALNNKRCLVMVKWFHDIFLEKYTPKESSEKIMGALKSKYPNSNFDIVYFIAPSSGYEAWDRTSSFGRLVNAFSPRSNAAALDQEGWSNTLKEFI